MTQVNTRTLYGKRLSDGIFHAVNQPFLTFGGTDCPLSGPTRRLYFDVDESSMFQHILLLGGSGSGKSNVIHQIAAQTMNRADRSCINIIFDTKADYFRHRGFYRPGDAVLGSSREFRSISDIWNILREVTVDGDDATDVESNAREISSTLFKDRGSKTQPFFASAARDLFASAMIYFIRRAKERPAVWQELQNNLALFNFLMHNDAQTLMKYLDEYRDFHGLRSYLGDGTSNQALGVLAELRSMLYDCFQSVFRMKAEGGRREFSIREAVRNKGARNIFIEYDLAQGETLTPIYRLLIDLALKEALSVSSQGRTFLFLDEMKLVPRLSHLEDAINYGRSRQVSVIAGLQSVGQMESIYGKEAGHVILGGFGTMIAMKTADHVSREYVSHHFGTNLTAYRYHTVNSQPVDRERDGFTVEQWDQTRLTVGQSIIGLSTQNEPFLFRFEKDPTA